MKKFLLVCFTLVFTLGIAWAQERVVTGKVTSADDGSALPGVNVVLKGSTNGTVTDADGSYSISTPSSGVLVFSFIGLQTQEVPMGEKTVVDVSLGADVKQLSEIVITGTGVATEKRKLAIAVESVSAEALPQAPTASIDQALVGKIAGAQISSVDGTPGAKINILLRGVNTLGARGTNPMILVDGVQVVVDLNSLDLSNIARVEVVQGAAAATIYGAQGANGVIQIFTKKGIAGKINIDITTGYAANSIINSGNVRQSQFHNFATDASGNIVGGSGSPIFFNTQTGVYSGNVVYNALDPVGQFNKPYVGNFKYIDQVNRYLVDAVTTNNSISLSGGKDKFDFSVTVSNNHQTSNFKGDGYNDRTNVSTNVGFQVAKGLDIRSITQLIRTENTINYFNQAGYGGGGVIYNMLNTRPFVDYDLKDADGNYSYRTGDAAGVNGRNPNYRYQFSNRADNKISIVQNFQATYKFPKFVELNAKYGINYQTEEDKNNIANQSQVRGIISAPTSFVSIYNGSPKGEITTFENTRVFQNFYASAIGNIDFKEDLKMNIAIKSSTLVAFDYRNDFVYNYWTYGANVPTYSPYNATQATTFKIQNDYRETFITYGFLINQRFDFGEIGGISGGVRTDYSSAFGSGSTPFTFPRGDAYFRISSLKFWDNAGLSKTILEWKFRGAYGQAGIQPGAFDRQTTLGTRVFGSGIGFFYPNGQSNPALNVEVSTETEIGTDIMFDLLGGSWLKSLSLSATYWTRTTDNAIFNVDTAPSTGVGSVKSNAFSLGSHGLQISLNLPVYSGPSIAWNLTTNFSKQYSEITSLNGAAPIVVLSNAGSSNYVLRAGEAIGQLYGYKLLTAVDQKDRNGNPYITAANQANYSVASNGYVVNSTTKQPIGTTDLYSLGNSFPDFNASFINEIKYKDFLTVGFQWDWVYNSHLYNQTKSWMYRDGISSDYEKPITVNGETGAWTSFYRGVYQAGSNNGTKDYFYEDATFLRLRNVSIGLDFAKLFKIQAFRKLQLVASGRNLATITKYTGFDPEVSSGTNNSPFDRGVDHSTLPNYKSYQLTLNIGL